MAALFLKKFINPGTLWVHIDYPGILLGPSLYSGYGATGDGRTILHALEAINNEIQTNVQRK
jgi:leucyl aminopeptidase